MTRAAPNVAPQVRPHRRRVSRPGAAAIAVALDPISTAPLHRQVYDALRQAVLDGRLRRGARLPATRALAAHLDVARNTVLGAYEQLLAEGYLVGRAGSGTFVADELPERAVAARRSTSSRTTPAAPTPPAPAKPSKRGEAILAAPSPFDALVRRPTVSPAHPEPGSGVAPGVAFKVGVPALDAFPVTTWGRLLHKHWHRAAWQDAFDHFDPRGYRPLREAIADYVATARAVRCTADQVVVVSGTQQAVALAAQVLLDPGDRAWVEDPGYPATRGALVAAGARPCPVPVDAEGLDVGTGIRRCRDARLALVTPAHQLPTGASMSLARRLALLEWAGRAGAWLVEDDYDSEFRYAGRPLASLQSLDAGGRVIYTGTFSKVLTPDLRLGYLVVPDALVDAFTKAKSFADVASPTLPQVVLADFITEGHFARHVRRMRVLYAKRQQLLLDAAQREFGDDGPLTPKSAGAGMHLLGRLPAGWDDAAAANRVRAHGVRCEALSNLRVRPAVAGDLPGLLLGYAAVPEAEIAPAVRRLAAALRTMT